MKRANERAEKAKRLMYKKPALLDMQYSEILQNLYDISDECANISYLDDDAVLSALDDNEDLLEEFKMLFTELLNKCERLTDAIGGYYASCEEYFDDCIVGLIGNRYKLVGYDDYEEDYFELTAFEENLAFTEAGKRIMRNTKAEMLSKIGQCVGGLLAYWDIKKQYESLEAIFDLLRGEDATIGETLKNINDLYDDVMDGKMEAVKEFDRLLETLPDKVWVQ